MDEREALAKGLVDAAVVGFWRHACATSARRSLTRRRAVHRRRARRWGAAATLLALGWLAVLVAGLVRGGVL